MNGRMGMLAFSVFIPLMFIYVFKNNIVKMFLFLCLFMVLIFGSAYEFCPNFQKRINVTKESLSKFQKDKDFSTSSGQRFGIWIIAKDMFLQHPIVGYGGSGYRIEFERLYKEKYNYMDEKVLDSGKASLHNEYIQVAIQYGLIGLILYFNMFLQFIRTAIKNKNLSTALFFLVYYFSYVLTDIFFERYRTLYLLIIFLPIIAFNTLNKEIKDYT
jgi:O-antigen ligase